MKILLGLVEAADLVKYIIEGLKDHDVVYFLTQPNNIIPDANKIIYDYATESFHDILAKLPEGFIPDVVILWGPEYNGIPSLIEESPYPLFSIVVDWNVAFSSIKNTLGCFDYTFVLDPKGLEILKKYGYFNCEYIQIVGFDPKTHYKINGIDKIYDVVFIGNLNNDLQKERCLWLKRLAKLSNKYNVKILSGIFGQDYTLALNQAKITFNRSVTGTINMRVYEAAACNSLLFYEEENINIREVFQDREHCVLYNDQNMEELIAYYLTHDDERERICINACKEVQKYSYQNQLNRLLKRIEELLPSLTVGADRKFVNLPEIKKYNFRAIQPINTLTAKSVFYSLAQLERALIIDPNDNMSINNMACLLADFGQFNQALNILSRSCQAFNNLKYFNISNIYLTMNKKIEAIEYFNKNISYLENNPGSTHLEGLIYPFKYDYFKVEWEKCDFTYLDNNEAIKAKTKLMLYESYRHLSELYNESNDYDKSIAALKKTVKYREDSYTSYKKLSEIYSAIQDYEKAINNIKKAIEYYPLYPDYWINFVDLCILANKDCKGFINECLTILKAIPRMEVYIPVFEEYKKTFETIWWQPYKSFTMPHYNLEEAVKGFKIKITDKVLDVGGGSNPFERADVITELDSHDSSHTLDRIRQDKKYVECNVEKMPFDDKEFDFVYCNHILEHTDSPEKACQELMRIAKRGYLEVPSYWGEYVFGDIGHKWLIYWIANTLVFQKKPYSQKNDFNTPFDGIVHHLLDIKNKNNFARYWQIDYRNFWTIQLLWKDEFKFKVIDDFKPENISLESLLGDYTDIQYNGNEIKFPLKNAFGNNYPSFDIRNLINIFEIREDNKILAIGDNDYLAQFKHLSNLTAFNPEDEVKSRLPFKDKEFDFVFTGDTLVRISDPILLCDEMKRVAEKGFIELPNGWTEFIFKETDNKWCVENKNNKLYFHARNFVISPFSEILYKEYMQNEKLKKQYDILYRNISRIQYYWQNSFECEVETEPDDSNEDFSLLWEGSFFNPVNYEDDALNLVTAIHSNYDTNIQIHNYDELNADLNDEYLSDEIRKLGDNKLKYPIVNVTHYPCFHESGIYSLNIARAINETDSLPKESVEKFNKFDEIWVSYDFNMETFSNSGVDYRKLFKIPGTIDLDLFDPDKLLPLDIPAIKDKFVFLSIFDFQYRKGLNVLLKGFIEEFMNCDDVVLLLKIHTGVSDLTLNDVKNKIYSIIEKDYKGCKVPKIEFLDMFLNSKDYPRLYKTACCYVMPSRGEGWGRSHMEAMAMELPVIGTRCSGNIEFMTDEKFFLIDCKVTDINEDIYEYSIFKEQKWAEPDLEHFKKLLRYVYDNYEQAKVKGKIARKDIKRKYSYDKISSLIIHRIKHLLKSRKEKKWKIYFEGNDKNNINIEFFKSLIYSDNIIFSWLNKAYGKQIPKSLVQYMDKYLYSNDFRISNLAELNNIMPKNGHWIVIFEKLKLTDKINLLNTLIDKIWIFSPYLKHELLKHGINKEKIEYIPLGIPEIIVNPNRNRNEKLQFLFVGELIWDKGLDILIRAYCDAFTSEDEVSLLIEDINPCHPKKINLDELLDEIKQLKQDLPEIKIKAAENYDEVDVLYQNSDVFIYPYRIEENFMWVLKAMAAKIPVLITDGIMNKGMCNSENTFLLSAGSHYLINNGIPSVYHETDIVKLSQTFKQIVNNELNFDTQIEKAKKHVNTNFSIHKFVQKINESLRNLQNLQIERFKSDDIKKYTTKGLALFNDKKFEDAELEFKHVINIDDNNWSALYNLLFTSLYQNKLDEFKDILSRMVMLNQDLGFVNQVWPLLHNEDMNHKLALYLPQRMFVCDPQFHDLLNLDDKRLIFTTRPSGKPYTRLWHIDNLSGFPDKKAYSNIIRFMEGDEIKNINICMNADEIWIADKEQRQKLIQVQYSPKSISYIPVLLDPDIFNNQQELELEQKSKFNLLFIWDTNKPDVNWQDLLTAYFESFTTDQEITLFIKIQPQSKLQDMFAQIEQFATDKNYDLENIPDIVILEEDIESMQLPSLLKAMDGLICPQKKEKENYYTLLARYIEIPLINCYKDVEDFGQQLLSLHRDKYEILRKNSTLNYRLLTKHNYKLLNKYIIKKLLQTSLFK